MRTRLLLKLTAVSLPIVLLVFGVIAPVQAAQPAPTSDQQDQQAGSNTPLKTAPASHAEGGTQQPGNSPEAAESTGQDSQAADIAELRRRLDVLATELEQLRSGEQEIEVSETDRRTLGLSPSAAAAYRKKQGLSFAGYGEMLYENFKSRNQGGVAAPRGSQLDFLRFVLYSGYRFTDQFIFNSELEVEHANEISIEFAYLDYLVNPHLTLRGGMLLVPLGLLNEFHEPNVFVGALRPETERRIIPTTWRENGAGILGSAGAVGYRAYVITGLDAAGFSAAGLRGGRQEGGPSKAADLAFAGRLEVTPTPGIFAGGGLYVGGADQGELTSSGRKLDVMTTIAELHGQIQMRGIDLRALYARAMLDGVAELNLVRGLGSGQSIAEALYGGYLQAGYNVLSQFTDQSALTPYYRFEKINTQAELAGGYAPDRTRDGTLNTLGVEFRPIHNIVLKTDYQWVRNDARTGRNQFNINLGYAF